MVFCNRLCISSNLIYIIFLILVFSGLLDKINANNYFSKRFLELSQTNSKQSKPINYSSPNSLKSDFARSVIGAAAGGLAGAFIVGYLPLLFEKDYDRENRNNAFYIRSYIGTSVGAAIGSATVLYLSKNRDISYWKLTGAVIIPPLLIVLPPSLWALSNESDELIRSAWFATVISIGVSTIWAVIAYRIQPLKRGKNVSLNIGEPYFRLDFFNESKDLVAGIKIVEFKF